VSVVRHAIDEHFVDRVATMRPEGAGDGVAGTRRDLVLALFDAQLQSRHLDFAARWLQEGSHGFYTIGSAGHEANAALGLLTRVTDPALLHYRSGGFYAARSARHAATSTATGDPIRDVLLSLVCAAADPMSGGRHKVFGHPELHIVPQTSTIGSHLPRAVGLAFAIGARTGDLGLSTWPADSIVVCSFGDASANHSTARGALNAAGYLAHRGIEAPVLFVCEDNGIGISTRTPPGWTERSLKSLAGVAYFTAHDAAPDRLLVDVEQAVAAVRTTRRPAVLHLRTVRFMGHAGSDAELGYRSRSEILADHDLDPLVATAAHLVATGLLSRAGVLERYEAMRERVMATARSVIDEPRLGERDAVMRPLTGHSTPRVPSRRAVGVARDGVWAGRLPEHQEGLTLAQAINAALTDVMVDRPGAIVFGEDVAVKGGVYGVTRGLRKRFGGHRVFDTVLDEQTILGTALGTSLAGLLPIPEIQYLAYLHNAEDQLRGEAASLQFFSNGQYRNGMVVRVAGLAYQRGFGGHFHNDNSVAVLRDIPGLVLCVPSHPRDAPGLLRQCVELAEGEGRVCVYLEPIAMYHTRDLHDDGDALWTAGYRRDGDTPPDDDDCRLGTVRTYGTGERLLVVTFGNGLRMSLRAAATLEQEGIATTVLDLRWLSPLPATALLAHARSFDHVLVVDETRASGGVGEAVVAVLVDARYPGALARVASADTYIPLGPASESVLLGEAELLRAARDLVGRPAGPTP
jgi:2-oxoisovalerate dehydrogenase E1 component